MISESISQQIRANACDLNGRRDLSAEHSMRMSVGYGGPARGPGAEAVTPRLPPLFSESVRV